MKPRMCYGYQGGVDRYHWAKALDGNDVAPRAKGGTFLSKSWNLSTKVDVSAGDAFQEHPVRARAIEIPTGGIRALVSI